MFQVIRGGGGGRVINLALFETAAKDTFTTPNPRTAYRAVVEDPERWAVSLVGRIYDTTWPQRQQ